MSLFSIWLTLSILSAPTAETKIQPDGTAKLEFQGQPGIQFFGVCVSPSGVKEQKIEGVTPSEVALEADIHKCTIERRGEKGALKVRLFQNKRLVKQNEIFGPTSGIEISIPLPLKKQK